MYNNRCHFRKAAWKVSNQITALSLNITTTPYPVVHLTFHRHHKDTGSLAPAIDLRWRPTWSPFPFTETSILSPCRPCSRYPISGLEAIHNYPYLSSCLSFLVHLKQSQVGSIHPTVGIAMMLFSFDPSRQELLTVPSQWAEDMGHIAWPLSSSGNLGSRCFWNTKKTWDPSWERLKITMGGLPHLHFGWPHLQVPMPDHYKFHPHNPCLGGQLQGKPTHCRGTCEAPLEERHDSPPLARTEPGQDLPTKRAFQKQFHINQVQTTPIKSPKTHENPPENNCLECI